MTPHAAAAYCCHADGRVSDLLLVLPVCQQHGLLQAAALHGVFPPGKQPQQGLQYLRDQLNSVSKLLSRTNALTRRVQMVFETWTDCRRSQLLQVRHAAVQLIRRVFCSAAASGHEHTFSDPLHELRSPPAWHTHGKNTCTPAHDLAAAMQLDAPRPGRLPVLQDPHPQRQGAQWSVCIGDHMSYHHHVAPSPCCTITMLYHHHVVPSPSTQHANSESFAPFTRRTVHQTSHAASGVALCTSRGAPYISHLISPFLRHFIILFGPLLRSLQPP